MRRRRRCDAAHSTATTKPVADPTRRTQAFLQSTSNRRHTLPVASDGAVTGYGLSAPVFRRKMLGELALRPLVAVSSAVPTASADPGDATTAADAADTSYLYLSPHQAAVLTPLPAA